MTLSLAVAAVRVDCSGLVAGVIGAAVAIAVGVVVSGTVDSVAVVAVLVGRAGGLVG